MDRIGSKAVEGDRDQQRNSDIDNIVSNLLAHALVHSPIASSEPAQTCSTPRSELAVSRAGPADSPLRGRSGRSA